MLKVVSKESTEKIVDYAAAWYLGGIKRDVLNGKCLTIRKTRKLDGQSNGKEKSD